MTRFLFFYTVGKLYQPRIKIKTIGGRMESREQYINRMACIAVKNNWSSGDFEWLSKFSEIAKYCISDIIKATQKMKAEAE